MKLISAKIGVLALVLVLCAATLSAGFAMWSQTLSVDGTVETGSVGVQFSQCLSNDGSTYGLVWHDDNENGIVDPGEEVVEEISGELDPKELGSWSYTDIDDPSTWSWSGTRYTKHFGRTECEIDSPGHLQITLNNCYPRYCGNVAYTIENTGTVPVALEAILLTHVSCNTEKIALATPVDMTAGDTKYVHFLRAPNGDIIGAEVHDTEQTGIDPITGLEVVLSEFSLTLSHLNPGGVMTEIMQAGHDNDKVLGDLGIRIEDGSLLGDYDFDLEIVAAQYNEAGM